MAAPILFYADFTSPHTYLAIPAIERVAEKHGRDIEWRLISLFQVWDAIDYHPLGKPKAKARYVRSDFERAARVAGLAFTMPATFPVDADLARRVFWRLAARDRPRAQAFAAHVFEAYWGRGADITEAAVLEDSAALAGAEAAEIAAATTDEAAARAAVAAGEQAVADGVFGVPFFLLDGEPFWGHDRVAHIDWVLSQR